jgi:hypothetical protein
MWIDPVLSLVLTGLLLRSALRLLWEGVEVLLEAAPYRFLPSTVTAELGRVPRSCPSARPAHLAHLLQGACLERTPCAGAGSGTQQRCSPQRSRCSRSALGFTTQRCSWSRRGLPTTGAVPIAGCGACHRARLPTPNTAVTPTLHCRGSFALGASATIRAVLSMRSTAAVWGITLLLLQPLAAYAQGGGARRGCGCREQRSRWAGNRHGAWG